MFLGHFSAFNLLFILPYKPVFHFSHFIRPLEKPRQHYCHFPWTSSGAGGFHLFQLFLNKRTLPSFRWQQCGYHNQEFQRAVVNPFLAAYQNEMDVKNAKITCSTAQQVGSLHYHALNLLPALLNTQLMQAFTCLSQLLHSWKRLQNYVLYQLHAHKMWFLIAAVKKKHVGISDCFEFYLFSYLML